MIVLKREDVRPFCIYIGTRVQSPAKRVCRVLLRFRKIRPILVLVWHILKACVTILESFLKYRSKKGDARTITAACLNDNNGTSSTYQRTS